MSTPTRTIAHTDLCRTAAFELRSIDGEDGDGRTIDGYAAVYDTPTRIDSWEGTFDEQFAFGSFRKSLQVLTPRMQFDHGRHPLLGSLPLGVWRSVTEERDKGLHVVGRMSDNWLVQPFRDAIADGAVDGMSIRFEVVREEWRDAEGKVLRDPSDVMKLLWDPGERGPLQRTIKEAKLPEAGPVTWPAYQTTSVGVRSRVVIDLGRLDDPAQRAELARAVFLADASTAQHPGSTTDDAQPDDQPTHDEHPPQIRGAQPADLGSHEGHPSATPTPPRGNPARDFARTARLHVASLRKD